MAGFVLAVLVSFWGLTRSRKGGSIPIVRADLTTLSATCRCNIGVCTPMPRFDDLPNDAEIKILLPDAMKHALQVRALAERRSMSDVVRDLISKYLETE